MSLDASWDTFDDSSESEDDAAGSGGDEAAPPNAVEVLTEADLDRMAVACEIEAEARKVLHDMETTAFAFSGATRSFGEYFDTSMGYVVKHTTQKRRLIQKVLKWAHRVATSAGGQSISGR
ncbi:hypothetical protein JL720_296 [Aureococcus anophagefferens]|nr:hypothetical protein JL720_296 [Aureococcus anophagefferens]